MKATPSPRRAPAETVFVTDFELVRNAAGAWLLIVPGLPQRLLDNPLDALQAELDGANTRLRLHNHAVNMELSSMLGESYLSALRSDRPSQLLLVVVDEDGTRREGFALSVAYAG